MLEMVGRVPVVGSALRKLARRFPEGSVVEIRSGVAAGYKWRRHHRYVNGYWLGHYELEIQDLLQEELKSGQTFFDVGANAGFFTLVAAKLVGTGGRCVAFDPAPANDQSIREQLELNGLSNCVSVPKAVGARAGTATFAFSAPGSAMGHLGAADNGEQSLEVQVISLDEAAKLYGRPDFIKLDVEGADIEAMQGATDLLRDARPRWLIELHGENCQREVGRMLREAGYTIFDLAGKPIDPHQPLPRHILARP
jgi:FkbM family methyltransferase